jgi:hypothetical protein
MFKSSLISLSSTALFLSLTTTSLAGGGPIYLESQPYIPFSESRAFIVEAHITPDIQFGYNCHDIPVTFKFENPQPGDVISAGDWDKTNPTTIILGYSERRSPDGVHRQDCSAIAKVVSGTQEDRLIYVEADLPKWGHYKSSVLVLPFGNDAGSKAVQGRYQGSLELPWEMDLPPFYGVSEDGSFVASGSASIITTSGIKV